MHGTSFLRRSGAQIRCALVVLGFTFAHAAMASAGLDFGYAVDGPPAVRPVLVFNDGTDTYVQPADGIPTTLKGAVRDGPYLRIAGLPDTLKVQAGRYAMEVNRSAAPNAPQSGDINAMRRSAERTAAAADRATAMGLSPNESALSSSAVAALAAKPAMPPLLGATQSVAATSTPATTPATTPTVGFTLLRTDGTVHSAFDRWGHTVNWTVKWDSSIVAPLSGDTAIAGSFPDAVMSTLRGLRKAGYPLWAAEPDTVNHTIRVYQSVSATTIDEAKQ
jgi:hypothetical protein